MTMRLIWRHVVMNVMMTLEYRAAFFVYMINTVVTPLISLLVWLAVAEQGVRLPYGRSQFVTYYVLLSVVSMLTSTWLGEYVAENIRLGGLSPLLLRPAPFLPHYIGNNIGEKVINAVFADPSDAAAALAAFSEVRQQAGDDPLRLSLDVPREQVAEVAGHLLRLGRVVDLSIEEVPVEEIIRGIFNPRAAEVQHP